MELVDQFISMGMSPEEAKKNAENFTQGLKELGLSDISSEPLSTATPAVLSIVKDNNKLEQALVKVGTAPSLVKKYSNNLESTFIECNIETIKRQAMFLAQVLHESAMLSATVENLNYSELSLVKVFKNHFDRTTAKIYARHPEKIANRVYANRMGNGDEASGDGWKFKGRGFIQLTGKANYIAFGHDVHLDLIKNPDYLTTPEGAARSAGWFWQSHNLNKTADVGDVTGNTRIINGGNRGVDHRAELYRRLLDLL